MQYNYDPARTFPLAKRTNWARGDLEACDPKIQLWASLSCNQEPRAGSHRDKYRLCCICTSNFWRWKLFMQRHYYNGLQCLCTSSATYQQILHYFHPLSLTWLPETKYIFICLYSSHLLLWGGLWRGLKQRVKAYIRPHPQLLKGSEKGQGA